MTTAQVIASMVNREADFPQRVVAVEYFDGEPGCVLTQYTWDHSKMPWFRPGLDTPTGEAYHDYGIERSKTYDQLYWHNRGGGGGPVTTYMVARFTEPSPPKCKLWLAPGVVPMTYVGPFVEGRDWKKRRVSDAELLRRGYERIHRPLELTRFMDEWERKQGRRTWNPFAIATGDTACVYCRLCDDWLPDDSDHPCEHLDYCDECQCLVYPNHTREDDPDGEPIVHTAELTEAN